MTGRVARRYMSMRMSVQSLERCRPIEVSAVNPSSQLSVTCEPTWATVRYGLSSQVVSSFTTFLGDGDQPLPATGRDKGLS